MNILITGGSGNLGKAFVKALTAQSIQKFLPKKELRIVCFDLNRPSYPLSENIRFFEGSITDPSALNQVMQNERINTVVHVAGLHGIHEATKTEADYEELNVRGTEYVLESAEKNGVDNFVFLSSTSIESDSPYGRAKQKSETLIELKYATTMKVASLRAGAFIPYTDTQVYSSRLDWAKWFWRNGILDEDVANIVWATLTALDSQKECGHRVLYATRPRDFDLLSEEDLKDWTENGPENTFAKQYPELYRGFTAFGINVTKPPKYFDIRPLIDFTGYTPQFGLLHVLNSLQN